MRYICVYICVLYIYKYMCMYIYIQSSWRIFWSWRYSCDIQILQHLRASMSAAIVGCVAVTITFLQWPWHCCSGCYIIEVAIILLQWLLHCCSAHSNSSSIPSHIYTTPPSIHTYMCCTTHSPTFTHALSLSLSLSLSLAHTPTHTYMCVALSVTHLQTHTPPPFPPSDFRAYPMRRPTKRAKPISE